VFGDYELLEEIARGGMGVIYKARQLSLDRLVAVKMILAGRFASKEQIERFHTEAQAAGQLRHPNIVAIHHVGELDGQPFYSMDYVEGQNLAERVRQQPLPPKQAARYLQLIAQAVQFAHEHGVIHRDLKPSNILIDAHDQPQITDFGLAKSAAHSSDLTVSGQVFGSPNFASPEQAAGETKRVGPPSDVYSLGAILYYLLTGRPPFLSESIEGTLHQVLKAEPPAPRLLNPAIPHDLETICLRCLEKEPERRYRSAKELAEELERFFHDQPIRARAIGGAAKLWRWCRRNPTVAALGATTLLLFVAVLIGSPVALWRINREAQRAKNAQNELRLRLWDSYRAQAQAVRTSGRAGRRFESLDVIRKAIAIKPSLELRNQAIASLALSDIRLVKSWAEAGEQREFGCLDVRRRRYAYAPSSGEISIRSIESDTQLLDLPTIGQKVQYLAEFSPQGNYLLVLYADRLTRAWHLDSRQVLLQFPTGHYGDFNDFSADDGRLAVCSNLREVDLYDLARRERVKAFPLPGQPHGVRFHPTQNVLAVLCREPPAIHLLDLDTGNVTATLALNAPAFECAWHPEGEHLVSVGEDKRLNLWNTVTSERLKEWAGHELSFPVRVAFHPSGRSFVSSGWDGKLRLWSFPKAEEIIHIGGEGLQLEVDPMGRWLSCYGWDGNWPRLYELAAIPACTTLQKKQAIDEQSEGTLAFSRNGQWLAYPTERGVQVWHSGSGRSIATLPTGLTRSVLFAPGDDHLLVSGTNGCWDWPLRLEPGNNDLVIGPPRQVAPLARSGRAVAGSESFVVVSGNSCAVVDRATMSFKTKIGNHPRLRFLAVQPDGSLLATGGWNAYGVKVWNFDSGELVKELTTALSPSVEFTPDGRALIVGTSEEYAVWDTASWSVQRRLSRGTDNNIQGTVAFSPAGDLMAVAHTRSLIRLLRLDSFEVIADLESPNAETLFDLEFSLDGAHLAALRGADTVELWDLAYLRGELASLRLDWDLPPLPAMSSFAGLVRVKVILER
jgi:WD40 repeat protein/tRNA A-37 threonylcarbamoyl transferase component Bud32